MSRMLSKSIKVALFCVAAACLLTLGYSRTNAQAQAPTNKTHPPVLQRGASTRNNAPSLPAGIIYTQPISSSGALLQSSWWDPNGSDYDQYVWDNFTLSSTHVITEIHWSGGYDPAKFGSGGPVIDFSVKIYPSIPAGSQPDVVNPPLVDYQTGGNAGQTLAGTFGGTTMYDYQFALPASFYAEAGTRYWVQIEAWQHGIPDWGISVGTGGDGVYFRRIANVGDIYYQLVPGDAAFTLLPPPTYRIYLPFIQK